MDHKTQHNKQIQHMWYVFAIGLALFLVVADTWYQVNELIQDYQYYVDRFEDFGYQYVISLIISNFVHYTNVFIVGWMLAFGLLFWNTRISRRAWWVFVAMFGMQLMVVFVVRSAYEYYQYGNWYSSEMLAWLWEGTSIIGWIIPIRILRYEFDLFDNQVVLYNGIVNLLMYVLCVSIGISALRHQTPHAEPLYLRRFRYPHVLVLIAAIIEGIGFVSHRFLLVRYTDENRDPIFLYILYQMWYELTSNRMVLMSVILIAFFVMCTPQQRRVIWVVYAGAMVIGWLMTTSHAAIWDFLYQNCDEVWRCPELLPFELYTMIYAIGAVMSGAVVSWPYLRSFLETPKVSIPPPSPPSFSTDTSIAEIERLEGLLQRGLIDQDEFQQLKKKILARGE